MSARSAGDMCAEARADAGLSGSMMMIKQNKSREEKPLFKNKPKAAATKKPLQKHELLFLI